MTFDCELKKKLTGFLDLTLTLEQPAKSDPFESLAEWSSCLEKKKMGDHRRMWEDDLGTVKDVPLYNRMNFATIPRKSVNKKTW